MNGPMFTPPGGGGVDGADAQTMAAVRSVCVPFTSSILKSYASILMTSRLLHQSALRRCEARGSEASMGGLNLKGEGKCN
jgi:hypothetical protein